LIEQLVEESTGASGNGKRSSMTSAISVQHATKRYGDFVAVDDLSLEVPAGTIFGLLGPNGAGKSTTIRMIVNITMPDAGEIHLYGQRMNPELQQHIGYLPEDRGLYKRMKVGEQLAFFAELKGVPREAIGARIDHWLERVEMTEWKNRKWEELSKGMQQKIQFVSTILHNPDLIILDEPFSGLDPINVVLLKEIVRDLQQQKKTIIFSTHLMEQAEEMCDEICLINQGRRLLSGSIREIKRQSGWRYLAIDGEDEVEAALLNYPQVATVESRRDHFAVTLPEGADPQALLTYLLDNRLRLTRYELVAPTLNEIFIQKVKASTGKRGQPFSSPSGTTTSTRDVQ
jgi:ABC-2 type transport system ATP-binding protein